MNIGQIENPIYRDINIVLSIRRYREFLRLSQQKISNYIGITRSSYTQFESGSRVPDLFLLNKLSKLYNISVEDFYYDRDPEQNKEIESIKMGVYKKIMDMEVENLLVKIHSIK